MTDLSNALARLGVATVYESNNHKGWISGLTRVSGGSAVAGRATTAVCEPFDNLGLLHCLASASAGQILVAVSTDPSVAHTFMGDVIGTEATTIGLAGMLIDGYVRDADDLVAIGMPVWSKGTAPYSPQKNGPWAVDVDVSVSGIQISPGDYVVMDGDGAVVVSAQTAAEVVAKAEDRSDREVGMRERIKNGERILDIGNLRDR